MNLQDCQTANWESKGYNDASENFSNRFTNYSMECAEFNIKPDQNLYESGFNRGLQDLCTFQNGYLIGLEGNSLPKICPLEKQETFVKGFIEGQRNHDQKIQNDRQNKLMEQSIELKKNSTNNVRSCSYDSDCTLARSCLNYRCEISGKSCNHHSDCLIMGRCERNQCKY